ncbi:MAG: hypothetical protein A4E45_01146 [Methanosaeta sp. PtaB.Bin039]|nr:MAG: hypothetical protein A4E45_01146 [Methanosaeta sp. PtaB.Bin039]
MVLARTSRASVEAISCRIWHLHKKKPDRVA